ncbi:MAG: DUF493 domain-containing protein [Geopsychrobacter sp.]|nr:DUF493 domain-containing protein [Geopsychrobacter sp.]
MSEPTKPEDLLEFPCQFTFKAVGSSGPDFSSAIAAAVGLHAVVPRDAIHTRPSGKGNYQAVSIMVSLQSYQQLTAIYAAMKDVNGVKMLL